MNPACQSALDFSKSVLFQLSYDPLYGSCNEVSGLQRAFEMAHYKIKNSPLQGVQRIQESFAFCQVAGTNH